MINYDNIPNELKKLTQWVCSSNNSKVPMKAFENDVASSTDPDTWCDFETALNSVNNGYYDYCGFVFADNGYVGIDIDNGYDDYSLISSISSDIIGHCKSYTEKSRSGNGFHILLRGNLPFTGRNNLAGLEIYKSLRYFIMTGDILLYKNIIENQEAIDYVVEKYFQENRDKTDNTRADRYRIYKPRWEHPVTDGKIRLRPNYPEIHNGSRNICLTSLAGMLHSLGYNKKQIYDELSYVNMTSCEKALDTREIQNICNSITRYKR